jgi:predicted nucleic acid-binding protein
VIFLLDVNALLAMRYADHVHHARVMTWAAKLVAEHGRDQAAFATCPITELGFVRVGSGKAGYAASVKKAQADLHILQTEQNTLFIPDGIPTRDLPAWVRKSAQTTDGYLLELAKSYGGYLATLDRFIPGALLIPDETEQPLMVREEPVHSEWATHSAHGISTRSGSTGIAIG